MKLGGNTELDELREEGVSEKLGSKRRVLKWVPPVAIAVMLPTHAQATTTTTTTTVAPCNASLVVNNGIYKCIGVFPDLTGESEATVLSDSVDVQILSISSHPEVSVPSVPVVVSSSSGITLSWAGVTASDTIQSCPPSSSIVLTFTYTCGNDPEIKSQNLTVFSA